MNPLKFGIASDNLLSAPTLPGIWALIKIEDGEPKEISLQEILYTQEHLYVRPYVAIDNNFVIFDPLTKVEIYNRSNFRWILIVNRISDYLEKFIL